ncbi:MAG: oligosaccharide flippase family protein [Sphingobacteriales bacterium]|nr:MAG: oligosaccharide flippase family protein [Sphingobacteriales bacterium]
MIVGKFLSRFIGASENRAYLIKGSAGTFALHGSSILLGFLTSWIFAKLLGVDQYGLFTWFLSWLTVLGTLAVMGLELYLVKLTANYRSSNNLSLLKGAWMYAVFVVLTVSALILLLTALLFFPLNQIFSFPLGSILANSENKKLLAILLLCLPFIAISRVFEGMLRGAKFVISSQFPEMLVKPLLLLVLAIGCYCIGNASITLTQTIYLQICSIVFATLIYAFLLVKKFPGDFFSATAKYEISPWTKGMLSFLAVSILSIINTRADLILLGSLASPAEVGIYNIAARLADVPKTILIAANLVMAPMIADFFTRQDFNRLQKLLTKSVRLITLSAVPIFLAFVFGGKTILSFWGIAFKQGYFALVCMGFAQLFNLAMGSVGVVLMMTGHQRWVSYGLALGTATGFLLNLFLIPLMGLNGAAFAALASTVVWNFFLAAIVIKKLGLDPTILGFLKPKPH